MGGVGLGGVASFLGIFAMNGALVGSLFGAFGGKMTGEMVDSYAKEVSDFKFLPVAEEWGPHATKEDAEMSGRRLRVTVGINGWLNSKEDVIKPWRVLGQDSEVFALRYEMNALIELGNSLKSMVSSYTWSYVKLEILKRTVLATLWSALWPVYLLKMATSIDNPFAVARNRSEKAGEVLADALINKAQGERPVTLIGYSLGSRVIYSCLKSLAERKAFGLVESVVFIGSPVPSTPNNWRVMRSVVSGQVINVYSENDYILAFLYRATSIQFGVAGLQEIADVEGVRNLNLSKEVSGHLRYPELIGKILKKCGFGGIQGEDADGDIEGDVAEIQLIDVETEGMKVDADAMRLSEAGLLEMINNEPTMPVAREGDVEVENLTWGMADVRIEDESTPVGRGGDRDVENLTRGMGAVNVRDDDDDFDNGGIQMVDNDSDDGELREIPGIPEHYPENGELREIPGLPEPYPEEEVDRRESGKISTAAVDEQKFLGSFPRDRPSPGPASRRVTASDMGLY